MSVLINVYFKLMGTAHLGLTVPSTADCHFLLNRFSSISLPSWLFSNKVDKLITCFCFHCFCFQWSTMWNKQADKSMRIMWTTSVCRHTWMPGGTAMMSRNGKTLSLIHLYYSHANEYQMYYKLPAIDAGQKTNHFIWVVYIGITIFSPYWAT